MRPQIRPASESDAEQIAAIYARYVRSTFISFELEPPDTQEMKRRLRTISQRWPWLVCARNEEVLGYAYGSEHRTRAAYQWSVDVTVYVSPQVVRGGIGRALYSSLLPLLQLQGFFNAFAGIALPNAASVGLHEAMGFRPVGIYRSVGYKLGAWRDVGWWQLPLQEGSAAPGPPLPIQSLLARPECNGIFKKGKLYLRI
jgi:phosphinothricin acetyltransferase